MEGKGELMIAWTSLIGALLLTYIGRAVDFYWDLRSYEFDVNFSIGIKFLCWTTSIFGKEFFFAIKEGNFRFAVNVLRVFIFHYGAVRASVIGFLKGARKMFENGDINLLQDTPERFLNKPKSNPSPQLVVEWLRNAVSQLFESKVREELFSFN